MTHAAILSPSIRYFVSILVLVTAIATADAPDDLDLREANVTAVTVTRGSSPDTYRFDVTLYHDDDGERGYADWWQVEAPGGDVLGRRVLTHRHSTAPFTRSHVVTVPSGIDTVIVRGHDMDHGFGGRAMIVALGTGETCALEQGSDPLPWNR